VTPVLLDTSAIVALLDYSQQYHARCVEAARELEAPLVTCEAVIAETCYLLRGLPRAVEAVLENVARGVFQIPSPLARSAAEVAQIMRKYRDVPASLADACLIHAAGQIGAGEVLTLDRDFAIYRWGRNKPFRLLIPLE